jgi:hypothetical protein
MPSIEQKLRSVTEDRRADWLFHTKTAAEAVQCGPPRKFGDWWHRTKRKLIELHIAQPGELAAEIAVIFAEAELERQRRNHSHNEPMR